MSVNLLEIGKNLENLGYHRGAEGVKRLISKGLIPKLLPLKAPGESPEAYALRWQVAKLQEQPYNPEMITLTFQKILAPFKIDVPRCDWSKNEIEEPFTFIGIDGEINKKTKEETMLIYFPKEFAGKNELMFWEKIFPELVGSNMPKGPLKDDHDLWGWMKVDKGENSPYRGKREDQLRKDLISQGRVIQTLGLYIFASKINELFTGNRYDEDHSWSFTATRNKKGEVQAANAENDGKIKARAVLLKSVFPNLGAYSAQTLFMARNQTKISA